MTILFFGDVMGKSGRHAVTKILPELKKKHAPDFILANAENVAHGKGVTLHTLNVLLEAGVDFFTSGNHVFDKPEVKEVFAQYPDRIIRPANLPATLPGQGFHVGEVKNQKVLIINLNGQVFMEKQFDYGEIANPFLKLNEILNEIAAEVKIRILDFHAEATSEKRAMGLWADGRLSAVLGTHTHIPTADAKVLSQGTGYLTDLGMVGAAHSVIGMDQELVIKRFLAGPENEEKIPLQIAETDPAEVGYAVLEIDEATGKCQNIKGYLEYI